MASCSMWKHADTATSLQQKNENQKYRGISRARRLLTHGVAEHAGPALGRHQSSAACNHARVWLHKPAAAPRETW